MAYTFGNKCAKNCYKWTILVQLIIENVVTCFLEHSVVVHFWSMWNLVQFIPGMTQCHC